MRYHLFCLIFIISSSLIILPQHLQTPFYTETILIPADSSYSINYCYRIPYNSLVFEKEGEIYKAAYQINLELYDQDSMFISRQIKQKKISTDNFNESIDPNKYDQDLVYLSLNNDVFKLRAILTDLNSKREFLLHPDKTNKKSDKFISILNPIIINSDRINCNNETAIHLANYNGFIPFNSKGYELLVPILDSTINQIDYVILNNRDTTVKATTKEFEFTSLDFNLCDDEIAISNTYSKKVKYFLIRNLTQNLIEGDVVVKIKLNGEEKSNDYIFECRWINKPLSLTDYEASITYLKMIEDEKFISTMLSNDEMDYRKILYDYWKKSDPTPNTAYNELMAEFYSRVDYADMNFRPISGKSGVDTDRGKIYVKFGRPIKIDRLSNDDGYVIEKWIYNDGNNIFSFIDKSGTGNFQLLSNK